ncbi:uncharacterized protein G2W53_039922 [Senna tora]|uniref:Uncharacterized protein n=1 Tax=Senna tora TaxID=362788 RepID=A0A834SQS2_9FABA|nr:uncharacterized protein G2W53_039922 [Senna tora]
MHELSLQTRSHPLFQAVIKKYGQDAMMKVALLIISSSEEKNFYMVLCLIFFTAISVFPMVTISFDVLENEHGILKSLVFCDLV